MGHYNVPKPIYHGTYASRTKMISDQPLRYVSPCLPCQRSVPRKQWRSLTVAQIRYCVIRKLYA